MAGTTFAPGDLIALPGARRALPIQKVLPGGRLLIEGMPPVSAARATLLLTAAEAARLRAAQEARDLAAIRKYIGRLHAYLDAIGAPGAELRGELSDL